MLADVEIAASFIREAEAVLIAAGAGMGVDSGLPDYRGGGGLYNAYPPFAKLGTDYMQMTRPGGFRKDPALAWGFWGFQLNLYRQTPPHPGFGMLREICHAKCDNYFVQTTNVDGHFLKAGFDPHRVYECHGSIHRLQCLAACTDEVWPADTCSMEIEPVFMRVEAPLPSCPRCGGLARPNVFMFGDTRYVWDAPRGQANRFREWLTRNRERRLAIIECGAGTAVPGLRRHSEELARDFPHTRLVRINPAEPGTPSTPNCVGISMGALEALRQVSKSM